VEIHSREDGRNQIFNIVEKPGFGVAPSNPAVIGRYILTPLIFEKSRATYAGANDEIQLTDGISAATQAAAHFSGSTLLPPTNVCLHGFPVCVKRAQTTECAA
jgi:UTP-glucose-1-phosphate uridylyltransferase